MTRSETSQPEMHVRRHQHSSIRVPDREQMENRVPRYGTNDRGLHASADPRMLYQISRPSAVAMGRSRSAELTVSIYIQPLADSL